MQNELQTKAKELLESGQIKTLIGYEAGSVPFKSTPCFAATPEDADRLIWDPTCVNNLAVYLPQAVASGKVAIVLKPCDLKSAVELIKEHQIDREDVLLLVVSCPGVLSRDALLEVDLREVRAIEWRNGSVSLSIGTGEAILPREKALADKCLTCEIGEPVVADIVIGESLTHKPTESRRAPIEEYEKMAPAERRAFWARHFERCIRCYACRFACPGCYCKECFVDKASPMWASKATDPASNWFFHMSRAMHLAGRCIGCGECERVCPMHIPLSLLNTKIAMDIEAMFGAAPGQDPEAAPILGSFLANDPDPCPEP